MHELGTKYWFNRTESTDCKSAPAGHSIESALSTDFKTNFFPNAFGSMLQVFGRLLIKPLKL